MEEHDGSGAHRYQEQVAREGAHSKCVSPLPPPTAFMAACDACLDDSLETFRAKGCSAAVSFLHRWWLVSCRGRSERQTHVSSWL